MKRSPQLKEQIQNIIAQLRPETRNKTACLRRQIGKHSLGVTIFRMEGDASPGRFSVRRAIELDIDAPVEQVAAAWWKQEDRHKWDTVNIVSSALHEEIDEQTHVWVYQSRQRPEIPSRQISVIGCEVPAELLHFPNTARAFVQVHNDELQDNPEERGVVSFNTIALFVPLEGNRTRSIYVADIGADQTLLSSAAMTRLADDVPIVILLLKSYVEGQSQTEDS